MSPPTGVPRGTWLGLRLPLRAKRSGGLAAASAQAVRVVLALYVFAAALLPLAHHDVVCHLKSSTHCTTCVVGSSAEASGHATALAQLHLNDAGAAPRTDCHVTAATLPGDLSGRAPPTLV